MRRGQPGAISTETGLAAAPFHFGPTAGLAALGRRQAVGEAGLCPAKPPPPRALVADDLDDPASLSGAIELHEEDALPGAEAELAVAHRNGLARGPEQHRHAVRMAVRKLDVLGADVLGAPVPVVVRVVLLARDNSTQHAHEVLEEARLELVDPHAAG